MRLSVRLKLLCGFGALLALLVVGTLLSQAAMSNLNDRAHRLGSRDLEAVSALGNVRAGIMTMRAATGDNLNAPNAHIKAASATAIEAQRAAVLAGLQLYGRNVADVADAREFAGVRQKADAIVAAIDKTLAFSSHGQISQAQASYAAAMPLMEPFYNNATALAASRLNVARHDVASAGSAYTNASLVDAIVALASVALGVGIALRLSGSIKRRVDVVLERLRSLEDHCLNYVREGLEAFADGDLTRRYQPVTEPIENPTEDEIGQIARAVNALRDRAAASLGAYDQTRIKLNAIVGEVATSAGQVSSASQQMAANSDESGKATGEIAHAVGDIAQGAERTVQMLEAAKHSAEQVARAVTGSAESARATAEAAHEARAVAQQGVGAAEQANAAMRSVRDSSQAVSDAIRELAAKSEQIGQIVQTITGIAEQTNLLALNAAIEAARAGEQGRGFAVVAEEVRKLAEESQHAAREISDLIGAIQAETTNAVGVVESGAQRTQEGVEVVEQTREAFLKIGSSVEDMNARIDEIAVVSQQIAASAAAMEAGMDEIAAVAVQASNSSGEVSAATQQTSAASEEIAASAQELSGNADTLNQLVAQFKLTTGG